MPKNSRKVIGFMGFVIRLHRIMLRLLLYLDGGNTTNKQVMGEKLEKIMEEISKLTIVELNELIKSLEPIFNPKEEEKVD